LRFKDSLFATTASLVIISFTTRIYGAKTAKDIPGALKAQQVVLLRCSKKHGVERPVAAALDHWHAQVQHFIRAHRSTKLTQARRTHCQLLELLSVL
jgi:hypothetical protein